VLVVTAVGAVPWLLYALTTAARSRGGVPPDTAPGPTRSTQQLRERPRPAADVEQPVTVLQLGHLDELLSERACVPAHEPVVRVPTHLERVLISP